MLVTSSRPQMGPLPSSARSPNSHVHQLPADLSPRSSNSSLMSSNESLLNTSLSMPSPGARESVISPRGLAVGQGEVSPLQCLQNAFSNGRSPFSMFHEPDNEHLEQQIKAYGMMGSPVAGDSPAMRCESEEEMQGQYEHGMARTPTRSPTSASNKSILEQVASTIFQCPLCAVICNSRHDFNEHLVTHSQQHACPRCSFITGTEEELRDHVQEEHGVDDFKEMLSDDEVKTPKTNAQGKLKTFKCKHCEHRAVTKKEFWDHTKTHIREDKMLHCPKCPFVTEYKHHLEYHLRNHMSSKPYQCTKCPYSCVNKSMLNSHLKSHSNVYQYRCSDCSYATKYCHSLKLHLRKYNHQPAMVLNPDGTPNPLPIIDVYGTRRGPKMKRPDPILEGLATTTPALPYSPNHNNNNNNNKPTKLQKKGMSTPVRKEKAAKPRQPQHDARDLSPKLASSPRYVSSMPSQVVTPPLKKMKEDSSGDSDSDIRLQHSNLYFQNVKRVTQLPQAPISPSSIALILQQTNNGIGEQQPRKETSNFPLHSPPNTLQQMYTAAINQYLMNPALNGPASLNDLAKHMTNEQQTKMLAQFLQSRVLYAQQLQQQQHLASDFRVNEHELGNESTIAPHCPLDLSKNDDMMANNNNEEIKRRKRKGKASRYERRCSSEDEEEALDFSYNNNNNEYKENKQKRKYESPTDLSVSLNNLLCKYCEISFPDRELYAIHMNFHSGDIEPFLCRSCGKKTRDKVEFSRHLFTDPH